MHADYLLAAMTHEKLDTVFGLEQKAEFNLLQVHGWQASKLPAHIAQLHGGMGSLLAQRSLKGACLPRHAKSGLPKGSNENTLLLLVAW